MDGRSDSDIPAFVYMPQYFNLDYLTPRLTLIGLARVYCTFRPVVGWLYCGFVHYNSVYFNMWLPVYCLLFIYAARWGEHVSPKCWYGFVMKKAVA
jgi:hypothetical protein